MDSGHKNLEELFNAMETPEKWREFRKAKIKTIIKDFDIQRCDAFADYITKRFIDACNDKTVFGRFQNWINMSDEEKVELASDIVKAFLKNVTDDIWNDRVQIYTRDGSEYKKTNDTIDYEFKSGITNIPTIKTMSANINALMGVTRNGELYINSNFLLYKETKTPLFFLMDLRHEFMHIIDELIPNISPLNPETREAASFFYVSGPEDAEAYTTNESQTQRI